jgi:hypothetical protein
VAEDGAAAYRALYIADVVVTPQPGPTGLPLRMQEFDADGVLQVVEVLVHLCAPCGQLGSE